MKKLLQASTLNALMLGNFDRTISIADFLQEADTGLGTYTGLDGEAIFAPTVQLTDVTSIEVLKQQLAPYVEKNPNIFYLLKADATFDEMHVRSCYACQKPYPTLSEAASKQREFHYEGVPGNVIAVYCPAYVEGINLPGWHFHFLSSDRTKGGHILGLQAQALTFQLNPILDWELLLPENPEFARRNLSEDLSAKTAAVEGGAH